MLNAKNDLFLCGVYIPPEKSVYFENEVFDKLGNDVAFFASKAVLPLSYLEFP